MSDYPLWAYRQQLEQQARRDLGYGNPLMDIKQAQAIEIAIDEEVREFGNKQQQQLQQMVNDVKRKLT